MQKNNKIKKILLLLLLFFVGLMATFLIYYNHLISTSTSVSSNKVVFEVVQGRSSWQIAQNLKERNLIKSDWAFFFFVKVKDKTLEAGLYLLSPDMKMYEVVDKISQGNTAIRKITIPEGWRTEQIAQYLSNEDYFGYSEFITAGEKHCGKLFPDTYFISVESTAEDVVNLMLENYHNRIGDMEVSDEVIILASIIEREAKSDRERGNIAEVFWNRLQINMKLEADPTVLFANDSKQIINMDESQIKDYKFWQSVNFTDYLEIDSYVNTYLYKGLPSVPICNPGIKSIEAAVTPNTHQYYYFFHDKEGKIYFSQTKEEHEEKKENYLN